MGFVLSVTNDATQVNGMPASFVPSSTYPASVVSKSFGALGYTVHELRVICPKRTKRCFLLAPADLTRAHPKLGVAFPSSYGPSAGGTGASDLFNENFIGQDYWPVRFCLDHNVFMLAIDLPSFGHNSYFPTSASDPLIESLFCVSGARQYIEQTLLPGSGARFAALDDGMFAGGHSWGAWQAMFFGAACTQVTDVWACGVQLSKLYDLRPPFNPAEWSTSYDVSDMVAEADWCSFRFFFGGDGNDYLYEPYRTGDPEDETLVFDAINNPPGRTIPNLDFVLAELVALDSSRFSFGTNADIGHLADVQDAMAWYRPVAPHFYKRWAF